MSGSSSSVGSSKMVVLRSSDGETFWVSERVALESETIKDMIDVVVANQNEENKEFVDVDVTSSILALVILYCKRHVTTDSKKDLKKFDADFVNVDQTILFDIIRAANYLNIKSLLDLTCQTVADMIKGKTPEQIKKHFNVTDDFTPEEEEEVRRVNAWAFE